MVFVSVTRIKLKSVFHFIPFLFSNEKVLRRLFTINGFKKGKELIDRNWVFWTITIWDNENSMLEFRRSDEHISAIKKTSRWCNEGSYISWIQESTEFPHWKEVSERLITKGKLMKLRQPTCRHLDNHFPMIRWTFLERRLLK